MGGPYFRRGPLVRVLHLAHFLSNFEKQILVFRVLYSISIILHPINLKLVYSRF